MADALNPATGQTYGYDELHRLTAATGPFGTLAYGYDATGNRQSESRDGQTTAYHYLPTDQRLQSLSGSVNQSFAYDATGNTVDNGPFDFAYGGDLRLRHVTQGGHPVADYHYWHYATGQRTAKIVNGRVTHFDYAPWGPLLSESVGDVVSSSYPYADMTTLAYTDYVYLDDLPLAQIDPSGAVAYLHPNHLGAPLVATNENGEVVWQANYEPFGQASLVNPSVTLNLRLPGQYFDAETGLYQNWHRDYDARLGRYLQSDPIGLEGGLNTYAYVGNNPLNRIDPTGQLFFAVLVPPAVAALGDAAAATAFVGSAALAGAALSSVWDDLTGDVPDSAADDLTDGKKECSDNNDDDDRCYKNYENDISTCRAIGRFRGAARAEACYASAAERLAACRAGRPIPPLNTWNN
ncbi:RHS repeat-associated core domain-containing protein [Methylocaldum gracile]|uniref:RHS repeat-associated core domain-containing protein n=1 Tax=Methylocaldum sp. 0917 TaxID=2485163 RepID=UPI003DA0E07C